MQKKKTRELAELKMIAHKNGHQPKTNFNIAFNCFHLELLYDVSTIYTAGHATFKRIDK